MSVLKKGTGVEGQDNGKGLDYFFLTDDRFGPWTKSRSE